MIKTGIVENRWGYLAVIAQITCQQGKWVLRGALIRNNIYILHIWDINGKSLVVDNTAYDVVIE